MRSAFGNDQQDNPGQNRFHTNNNDQPGLNRFNSIENKNEPYNRFNSGNQNFENQHNNNLQNQPYDNNNMMNRDIPIEESRTRNNYNNNNNPYDNSQQNYQPSYNNTRDNFNRARPDSLSYGQNTNSHKENAANQVSVPVGDVKPELYFIGQISIGENFVSDVGLCCELLIEVGDDWELISSKIPVQTHTCYAQPGFP